MKKRTLLTIGGLTALALWLMRPGQSKPELAPTTERDGVGPATLRRYWIDIEDARKPPEEVLKAVLGNFAPLMPRPLASTLKVRGRPGVGRKGDRYFILMLVRPGFVETEVVEPLRFRNRTLRLHPESGWVEFRAIPRGKNAYRLQVQSSVRTSTLADRLAYKLGMSVAQARTWETMLQKALALSGGRATDKGRDTGEFETVPGGVKPPQVPGEK